MRLGLVFNPFRYKLHEENLRVVQKYFGLFPPLSLTWVAAIAEQAGHTVTLVDARTLRLSMEETLDRLKEFKPDILGFMMTTYMYRETLEWASYLRKHLKVPVIVGGYNLRVYPTESVMPEDVDFGCLNSAFITLPRLLEELAGQRRFHDVPGLIFKENDTAIVVPGPEKEERFEDYPNPARHLLPNELYAEFPTERKNFTVMVTSKGCPCGCTFCEAGRTSYNARTPMTVVNEMEECYTKHGIREIDIFDYEFPRNKKRTLAICREMQSRNLDITWACRARVDSVDEELLREMAKAGCSRIYYGIESGVQETLDILNKGITLDKIRETIRLTKEQGIKALGFFLIGCPGETRATVDQTIKFARELDLEFVQFSKLTAKPWTGMWKQLVEETGTDYWREYILGNIEEQPLPRPWTSMSNDQIDAEAKRAYLKFHCRPWFLLRSAFGVRSFVELRRKTRAFFDMVFSQEKGSRPDDGFVAYNENAQALRTKWANAMRCPIREG